MAAIVVGEGNDMNPDDELLVNRLQLELLRAVAHDLENGLQGLMARSEHLAREAARKQPDLKRVNASAADILEMAQMLREMVRNLRTEPLARSDRSVNLVDVARSVVQLLSRRAASRNVRIEVEAPADDAALTTISSDVLMRQVVYNLLDNAIKYSAGSHSAPSHVRLILRRSADTAEIEVQNQGFAIPPDEVDHFFEVGFRGRSALANVPAGVGLGLWMSKRILGQQGGTLEISSHRSGKGDDALFRAVARLPIGPPNPAMEPTARS